MMVRLILMQDRERKHILRAANSDANEILSNARPSSAICWDMFYDRTSVYK